MSTDTQVLVVNSNPDELDSVVGVLRSVGYKTTGTGTFETARELIRVRQYDLLITALRLLPYNGLHLVIHNQVLYPDAKAIVLVSPPDLGGEAEARRLGAQSVAAPVATDRLLAIVQRVLEGRPVRAERKPLFAVRDSAN